TRWRQLALDHAEVKAEGTSRDSWRFVISHEAVDLMGDIVEQAGLAPVADRIPAQVDHSGQVRDLIGWWEGIKTEGKRTTATLKLFKEGITPIADLVRTLLGESVRMAASIGFVPREYELIRDKEDMPTGYRFIKSTLIETSVVVVPAQPLALNISKSLGLTPERVARFVLTPASAQLLQRMPRADALARAKALAQTAKAFTKGV
ncbi:MAG: hypothetical protein ABW123_09025, partial [Cystobacter sp.]